MIISHRHKFIFFKTKKTAGTSIEVWLSQFCGPDDILTPLTNADEEDIRQAFSGLTAQNFQIPIHRLTLRHLLKYLFKKKRFHFYGHIPASLVRLYMDRDIFNSYFKFCFEREPVEKALSYVRWWKAIGRIPPTEENDSFINEEFLLRLRKGGRGIYMHGTQLMVDKIYKYENLQNAIAEICSKFKFDDDQLPHLKKTSSSEKAPKGSSKPQLKKESISLILKVFDWEYEQLYPEMKEKWLIFLDRGHV